jgi:peptidoglycan/xylan/chitin deacetylase (PgdA/CDA1 family)
MKKVLFLSVLMLMACKGRHLGWVSNEKNPVDTKPKLNTDIGGVRLSFDDGPDLSKTPKVLELLKKYNLQATFFVEGINLAGDSEQAKERRELLKRIVAEGHIVGNHSYDHHLFTSLSRQKIEWEVDSTTKLIEDITGQKVSLIRLPYGRTNKIVNNILKNRNLASIKWQIDPREWEKDPKTHRTKTADQVINDIMAQYHQLHNEQGMSHMILLLHDTKQITIDVLPTILDMLTKEK